MAYCGVITDSGAARAEQKLDKFVTQFWGILDIKWLFGGHSDSGAARRAGLGQAAHRAGFVALRDGLLIQ